MSEDVMSERHLSEPEPMTLPDGTVAVLQSLAATPEESQGDLVVTIDAQDKPVEANGFADTIRQTVKCLMAVAKSINPETRLRYAIIEAAIIGDKASFTLRAYDKQAFKVQKPTPNAQEPR